MMARCSVFGASGAAPHAAINYPHKQKPWNLSKQQKQMRRTKRLVSNNKKVLAGLGKQNGEIAHGVPIFIDSI